MILTEVLQVTELKFKDELVKIQAESYWTEKEVIEYYKKDTLAYWDGFKPSYIPEYSNKTIKILRKVEL